MKLITRDAYLNNPRVNAQQRREAYEDYMGQFVSPATLNYIESRFTVAELSEAFAENEHFNTIDLARWDSITWASLNPLRPGSIDAPFTAIMPVLDDIIRQAGEQVTRAILTGIAKEAARQIVKNHNHAKDHQTMNQITLNLTEAQQNAVNKLAEDGEKLYFAPQEPNDQSLSALAVLDDDQEVIHYVITADGKVTAEEHNGSGMGWNSIPIDL